MITEEEILGALARGYCDKKNAGKTLDPTLIESMTNEILKLLNEKQHDSRDSRRRK